MDFHFIRIRIGDERDPRPPLDRFVARAWAVFFLVVALLVVGWFLDLVGLV